MVKSRATRQVRRDHRGRAQPQHRPAPGRPDRARHGRCCRNGTGKIAARRRLRQGRQAPRRRRPPARTSSAPRIWRRRCRPGKIDFDRCIATPDMMALVGRLGKRAGAARADAQSQARHRDRQRRRGGEGGQGRPGRVPRREGGASSMPASARRASPRRRSSRM